ncbi:hypothetical protein EVAR_63794_1 [Eumeta japonica]|uniref:Uncharacterized protein n=1 Tax=Eumeta variegata TaxID=151549 RepID=A0A4C1ZQQ7_EUMVA|nr:hypothetical protein EVAR_63794_1 [Eumeta japonica]
MSYVAGHPAGVDECLFVWFVRAPWSVFAEVAGTYFLCSRRFAHGGVYIVEGRRDVLCIYDSAELSARGRESFLGQVKGESIFEPRDTRSDFEEETGRSWADLGEWRSRVLELDEQDLIRIRTVRRGLYGSQRWLHLRGDQVQLLALSKIELLSLSSVSILDEHFTSKGCGFAERHKFYVTIQGSEENYTHCQFSNLEEAILNEFVIEMIAGHERDKLFTQNIKELTLTKAVDLAESIRCARMGAVVAPENERLPLFHNTLLTIHSNRVAVDTGANTSPVYIARATRTRRATRATRAARTGNATAKAGGHTEDFSHDTRVGGLDNIREYARSLFRRRAAVAVYKTTRSYTGERNETAACAHRGPRRQPGRVRRAPHSPPLLG